MFDSRRYGNGANHVKVHTSEQVQQLLGALADEKDANGRTVMPFTYAVVVDMYATLMTKEKPSLQIDKQTDIITLRGKLWPLAGGVLAVAWLHQKWQRDDCDHVCSGRQRMAVSTLCSQM